MKKKTRWVIRIGNYRFRLYLKPGFGIALFVKGPKGSFVLHDPDHGFETVSHANLAMMEYVAIEAETEKRKSAA